MQIPTYICKDSMEYSSYQSKTIDIEDDDLLYKALLQCILQNIDIPQPSLRYNDFHQSVTIQPPQLGCNVQNIILNNITIKIIFLAKNTFKSNVKYTSWFSVFSLFSWIYTCYFFKQLVQL